MRVLLVGGGGREHALAWTISRSQLVASLYAVPGNPGIARHATCVPIAADALDDIVRFARQQRIDLTVVGPEVPLVAGLADRLAAAGVTVFGPTLAQLKVLGLMLRLLIPQASFEPLSI